MPAIRLLLISSALAVAACSLVSPPKPRGTFDLSSGPEPGTVPSPTLAPVVKAGAGGHGAP